jgi:hypothetical protein
LAALPAIAFDFGVSEGHHGSACVIDGLLAAARGLFEVPQPTSTK